MRRKFKDAGVQAAYDHFLADDPAPVTKGKGGAHNAYFVGRSGLPNRLWSRGSLAYAAWAAGRDNFSRRDT